MAVEMYPYAEADYATRIVLEPTTDGGMVYSAWYVELPGCESQGDTPEEARRNLRDAFALYVGDLVKHGLPVPAPSAKEVREIVSFTIARDHTPRVATSIQTTPSIEDKPLDRPDAVTAR